MKKLLATLGLLLTYGCSTPVIASTDITPNDHDVAWYIEHGYGIKEGSTTTVGQQDEYVQAVLLEDSKGDIAQCTINPIFTVFTHSPIRVTVSCADLYIAKDVTEHE